MTERKPPGVAWQTWVDEQIHDAEQRGEFDNLPGKGKPISDRSSIGGPPTSVMPMNVDDVVSRWQQSRQQLEQEA